MSDVKVTTAEMVAEDITNGFARMPKRDEGVHWLKAWEWDLLCVEVERLRGDLSETRIALANAECREGVAKARLAEAEQLLHELADGRVGDQLILNPVARIRAYFAARAADSAPAVRPCTCDPADSPPVPCPRKYALAECRAAGRVDAESFKMEVLACAGDTWECPRCGHSEPWWTESNADYATRTAVTPDEVKP